jgi:hypothetical protein
MAEKASLIIPSAKFVGIDLQNEFGPIPPVLVPIMGKIALHRVIESFQNGKLQTYVGIQEGAELVESYLDFFPDPFIHLVKIDSSESISDTIEIIIQSNPEILNDPILINFADTLVNDFDPSLVGKDFIYYSKKDETQRWTIFKKTATEQLDILDKTFVIDNSSWKAFTGLFGFTNTKKFFETLKKQNKTKKLDAFYNTVKDYFCCFSVSMRESEQWIDYGHIDNYYQARRQTINTRYFNNIKVSDVEGTITKSSKNKKLLNEIKWYLSIPKELRYYIPTIFDYSMDYIEPFIEIELYSYPSLDDCFVYSNFDLDSWDKIFRKIFSIIKIASKYTFNDDFMKEDLRSIYYNKTLDRLNDFLNSSKFSIYKYKNIYLNGKKLISLFKLMNSLESLIDRFCLYDVNKFQIIHGDLCFNNILYDRKNGIVKLIDPRGEFGRLHIYGDVYYDIAKISHSVLGLYDFIIFNQYQITENNELNYILKFRYSEYHELIGKIFIKHVNLNQFDLNRIKFIEALLFLSMIPYHKDYPDKQKVMLLRGLEIITDLIGA